ncbi:hypothetical protein Tco_0646700, partial [Tanacetum coccineum]
MDRTMLTFGGRGTSTQVLLSMRALYSSHIACFQLGSRCCEVDGSGGGGGGELFGGGVFGGSVVFSGDGVGNIVRGVVCGVAYGVVCDV